MDEYQTEKKELLLKTAQGNYYDLHHNPQKQAKLIARHYRMMAKNATKLEKLIGLLSTTSDPYRKCEIQMDIESFKEAIQERHFKDFGITLDWKNLTNIPQP